MKAQFHGGPLHARQHELRRSPDRNGNVELFVDDAGAIHEHRNTDDPHCMQWNAVRYHRRVFNGRTNVTFFYFVNGSQP